MSPRLPRFGLSDVCAETPVNVGETCPYGSSHCGGYFSKGGNMIVKKLKDFLDTHGVKYVVISHSRAYTAQEIAASAHVPGRELAKSVMVKVDGKLSMVVMPASHSIDFDVLKKQTGAKNVHLATEEEFVQKFPDCEVGAMPPFGNLYEIDVYVSEKLADDEEIAFNAGSHTELIRLPYADFATLAQPKVLKLLPD
jgi:Ala-tRNA(Pro) deacylase